MQGRNRQVSALRAREVLDCRGLPTVQVDLELGGKFVGRADVPSGRSTGRFEAVELRDGERRFAGHGVRRAVAHVAGEMSDALVGRTFTTQRELDSTLIALDGTPNKERLGANALLGVSLAFARACAAAQCLPLYLHVNSDAHVLPVPQFNLINGGRHAANDLDFQEFSIVPVGAQSLMGAIEIAVETNLILAEIIEQRYGKQALNTGDEGGYTPSCNTPEQALEMLHEAVNRAGYADETEYALDCAATHLYDRDRDCYTVAGDAYDTEGMIDLYARLTADYGITSIEDPLDEDASEATATLTGKLGIQIVGDDLFVTNPERLERGIAIGAANALLWKMNQIGTLSEALDAAALAQRSGYGVVVSERSGETEDPIIADMAVALNAGQIKTGAPVRGERTAKYNRLIAIEEALGSAATYAGRNYRRGV